LPPGQIVQRGKKTTAIAPLTRREIDAAKLAEVFLRTAGVLTARSSGRS
jgi:hypothetical protein